ncbi:hypothetical protein N9Z58_01300 [bacterium]|nr:hypothetical protein [bacterium]
MSLRWKRWQASPSEGMAVKESALENELSLVVYRFLAIKKV